MTQLDTQASISHKEHWLGWEPSTKTRQPWRYVAIALVLIAAVAVYWVYSYNPLAQSWQQSKGEWGSYVGLTSGVEAHFADTSTPGSPMGTVVWNEPTGKFVVQFETEIRNTGSHSVRIESVGEPRFGYNVSGYRVSFFRNRPFPHEDGATFRPFTLVGHSERIVTVSYSQFCTTKGPVSVNGRAMLSGPAALPVTYSWLGFAHTDEILVAPFNFVAPAHC